MKQPASNWRAGYGECDITPPQGHTLMAGYGRERHATGTLAPLLCQALALRDRRGHTVLFLAADVLAFDSTTTQSIRYSLSKKYGIAPEATMLAPSHTHWSAPSIYRMNLAAGGLDPWWLKRLEEHLLNAAGQALAGMTAASVGFSELQTRIGHARRLPGADGRIRWAPNPEGFYDEHTPILIIERRASGKQPARIVLLSHACHPTATGSIAKWNPDYPGAFRDELSRTLGRKTKAIFAMGCGGEAKVTFIDPQTGKLAFSASPARARAAGIKLARTVARHLSQTAPHELEPHLRFRTVTGALTFARHPPHARIEAMAYESGLNNIDTWWARQTLQFPDLRRALPYTVQCWNLGDELTLLGLEGEVCAGLGPLARSLMNTRHKMLIAYANAVPGYIPTARIVREGGYEGDTSHRAYFLPARFTPRVEKEFERIVRRAMSVP